ncbi:MAG: DUF3090 family protein [Thermomicrobiales bacterium]
MSSSGDPDFAEDVGNARVEAIGEPGQRRFRLIVRTDDRTTILWMEKQQVEALGHAIDRIFDQLDLTERTEEAEVLSGELDLDSRHQFRVGRIEIGYNQLRERILIIAYDTESEDDEVPALAALFPLGLAMELSTAAAEVVSAGRPRCVLCGMPMGPGPHACAEQNGHLMNYA